MDLTLPLISERL